jgi:hypothetical protein
MYFLVHLLTDPSLISKDSFKKWTCIYPPPLILKMVPRSGKLRVSPVAVGQAKRWELIAVQFMPYRSGTLLARLWSNRAKAKEEDSAPAHTESTPQDIAPQGTPTRRLSGHG